MADPAFRWHALARLFGPDGAELFRSATGLPVQADRPGGAALAGALAAGPAFAIRAQSGGPAPDTLGIPCFETLTSGSSGQPRRILRSQQSWTASFVLHERIFGIVPGRRVAVLGDLRSSLSLYGALEGLHLGADVLLLGGLRPDRQLALLALRRIEVIYATPAQLRALCRGGVLPDLQLLLCGGSKLDAGLRAELALLAPNAALREFYGAAEASFITLSDENTPPASVGRAYPGVRLEIRAGEVWVQSPYLFARYAGGGAPGGARWDEGWLSVGEMGRLEDGFLYLDGRKGRMVTVADQNVFPEAMEAVMEGLPGVRRAAVLPRPDAARGAVLIAYALGDAAAEAAVLDHLRAAYGPLKAPRRIIWLAEWPELASGKTDLAALVLREAEACLRA